MSNELQCSSCGRRFWLPRDDTSMSCPVCAGTGSPTGRRMLPNLSARERQGEGLPPEANQSISPERTYTLHMPVRFV